MTWPEDIRDSAVQYALTWLGHWYKWGGEDPSGFDCSGLTMEIGQAVGAFPRNQRWSAAAQYDFCKRQGALLDATTPASHGLRGGYLLFFYRGGKIGHVEMTVNSWQSIGAKGGGSMVVDVESAVKHNAFIKIRPVYPLPSDLAGIADLVKLAERSGR